MKAPPITPSPPFGGITGLKVCLCLALVCLPNRNCLVLLLAPEMIDARAKVDGCSFALAI